MNKMSITDMILKAKGKWLVQLEDKSKWVVDLDELMFDNYNWYSKVGTLETYLIKSTLDTFLSKGSWKRLK